MLHEIGFQDKDIKRNNGHCVLGNGNIERVRDHIFVRVNYANPGFACFCFVLLGAIDVYQKQQQQKNTVWTSLRDNFADRMRNTVDSHEK